MRLLFNLFLFVIFKKFSTVTKLTLTFDTENHYHLIIGNFVCLNVYMDYSERVRVLL